MIISFSVENFRSFKGEETLNLLASKRLGETHDSPHCTEVTGTDEYALRMAALYGANGAGKSNLVRALQRLKQLVLSGTKPGEKLIYDPFRLDHETQDEPTSFDLQFLADGVVFRYGVCYDADQILEEWLDVYNGARESNLFTRTVSESGGVEISLGPAITNDLKKIKALAEVGARSNQLFMTEIVNLDNIKAQGDYLQKVIDWFTSALQIVMGATPFANLLEMIIKNSRFAEFAGRFLCEASTGIDGLNVKMDRLAKEAYSGVPFDNSRMPFDHILELTKRSSEIKTPSVHVSLDPLDSDSLIVRQIASLHALPEGKQAEFALFDESDGTQRLLDLLPALYQLSFGASVFVIDELERSMHPMLARKFVEFFLKAGPQTKSQLIFTTHESTLLDLELLRRDEIWFAEKDRTGASHLYSLADFKVRNDLKIEKGYLQGRFGAIPFLGGLDRLLEASTNAEAGA